MERFRAFARLKKTIGIIEIYTPSYTLFVPVFTRVPANRVNRVALCFGRDDRVNHGEVAF